MNYPKHKKLCKQRKIQKHLKLRTDSTLSQTQLDNYLGKIDDLKLIVNEKEGVISNKEKELLELQTKFQTLLDVVEQLREIIQNNPLRYAQTHDMGV